MKVQLLSDLHFEFFKRDMHNYAQPLIHPEVDVVLLLGDIDLGDFVLQRIYNLCYTWGKEIIYVPGNHEFYGHEMFNVLEKLNHNFPNINIMTGVEGFGLNSVEIGNVRFLGGTLWTDFALYAGSNRLPKVEDAIEIGKGAINDFRRITYKGNLFTPENSIELHQKNLKIINTELQKQFEGKNVLLSHHGVHLNSIHPQYSADSRYLNSKSKLPGENPYWTMNPCFASHLPELLDNFDFAFHGHTHKSINFQMNNKRKTKVITNPRGYPMMMYNELRFENSEWNPLFVIDL